MRVVHRLNDRLARMQDMRVRHVVKEQQQIVRTVGDILIQLLHSGRVLADEAGSRGYGPIHADALIVCPVPLPPSVLLRGLRAWTVVRSQNVGERSYSEWARVILICAP